MSYYSYQPYLQQTERRNKGLRRVAGAIGGTSIAAVVFGTAAVAGGRVAGHVVANGRERQNNHLQQNYYSPAPQYAQPQMPTQYWRVRNQREWERQRRELEIQERKRQEELRLVECHNKIAELLFNANVNYCEVLVKRLRLTCKYR